MSLISSLFTPNIQAKPAAHDDFWYMPLGTKSQSGIRVTAESALKASAVFACIKVIAETIASLPWEIHETNNGKTSRAPNHPLYDLFHDAPNEMQTSFEWFESMVAWGELWGNSYAEIIAGRRGAVDQLNPIRPDNVIVDILNSGRLRFRVKEEGKPERTVLQDDMFRFPGFTMDGVTGVSTIFFANDPIGLALATEAFGSRFFSNSATPSGVLQRSSGGSGGLLQLSDKAYNRLRDSFASMASGIKNSHKPLVLEDGFEWKPMGQSNQDSQFLETRRYQIAEIARFFRVPLHMINDLEKSSFNNIEQQSIEFVRYTIRPRVKRIEQRINKDLIQNNQRFFIKANLDALLRGELKTRYEAHAIGINTGFLTRNEVREMENLDALPGLEQPLRPLNMDDGAQALDSLVADAAGRIVRAEVSEIKKALDKKDTQKALEQFFKKHESFFTKTMRPFVDALNTLHKSSLDVDQVKEEHFKNLKEVVDLESYEKEGIEKLTKLLRVDYGNDVK